MEPYASAPEAGEPGNRTLPQPREGMDDVGNAPVPREARNDRDRGPRSGRGRDRGERGPREGGGRDRGGRGRGRGRDRDRGFRDEPREPAVDPKTLPSPLTGDPVIYDMRTGKPKNRSEAEFRKVMTEYNGRLANSNAKFGAKKKGGPAIIKKISSKVTALFGKRSD